MLDADGQCGSAVQRLDVRGKVSGVLAYINWERVFIETEGQDIHKLCEVLSDYGSESWPMTVE